MAADTSVSPEPAAAREAATRHTPSPALRKSGDWARRAPLLPALIFTILMTQLPFAATLVISFMNWNAYYPDERGFAGFDNFARVFTDTNTRNAVWVTILLTVSVVVVSLVLGLVIALLLDRKFRGRGVVRTLMITPFLIVPVAAARIDGASGWQIFTNMTLPHLRQYIELSALLGAIYVVQNFDHVFTITSGGLGTANLPYFIYQTFYTAQDYGRASAAGVVVVIGTIIIATAALRTAFSLFREESR